MTGHNVLHTMGFDAFGLPAEQYAVQTGQHPRVTTESNIANMRRQLGRLGLGHDPRRSVATTDVSLLQVDAVDLPADLQELVRPRRRQGPTDRRARGRAGRRHPRARARHQPVGSTVGRARARSSAAQVVDAHRLAYRHEALVNWCPGLGTVLANEEVTSDGRSERGNFPVYRRPLQQWMIRITAYADRLIADLDRLDWPDSIKQHAAQLDRPQHRRHRCASRPPAGDIEVFTTRPDTLFGATYAVLAPEHPMVGALTARVVARGHAARRGRAAHATPAEAVEAYRKVASRRSDLERQADAKTKTGVFTGSYATNPVNGADIPVFVADYVLMGYGTGAIMAVPGQDQRDWDFAEAFDLPIIRTVAAAGRLRRQGLRRDRDRPSTATSSTASRSRRPRSGSSPGWRSGARARARSPTSCGTGCSAGSATGASRSRSSTTRTTCRAPCPKTSCRCCCPEIEDYEPVTSDDENSMPEPPLGRALDWVEVELDLGDGPKVYRREVNTMPQWAGSCWYELRYLDPTNEDAFVDPAGRAVLDGAALTRRPRRRRPVRRRRRARACCTCCTPGCGTRSCSTWATSARASRSAGCSTRATSRPRPSPTSAASTSRRPRWSSATGAFFHGDVEVTREFGKMGKSLKNSVSPDEMYDRYGADTLRLYEMFTGPLDQSRPWDTTAVVGVYRLLQRIWRLLVDEETGASRVVDEPLDDDSRRVLHRTIDAVRVGMEELRFNVSVAKITELNNHLTARLRRPRHAPRGGRAAGAASWRPLAPHIAEELWAGPGPRPVAGLGGVPRGRPGLAGGRRGRAARAGQRQGPGPRHGAGRRRRRRRPAGRAPGRAGRRRPPRHTRSAASSSSPAAWSTSSSPDPAVTPQPVPERGMCVVCERVDAGVGRC